MALTGRYAVVHRARAGLPGQQGDELMSAERSRRMGARAGASLQALANLSYVTAILWGVAAAFLVLTLVFERPATPVQVSIWWLALGFAGGEVYAVWVERRYAEPWGHMVLIVPLAVGLVYVGPITLVAARVVGTAAVLVATRVRSPGPSLYELGHAAVGTGAGLLAYTLVVGNTAGVGVHVTFALLAALFASWSVGLAGYLMLVFALRGWVGWRGLGRLVGSSAGAALLNSAIGIGLAVALWNHPNVLLLLTAMVVACLLSNRIFTGLSERHRRLEALYEFAGQVVRSVDIADIATSVLDGARRLLRADHAVLLLAPVVEGEQASRRVLGRGADAYVDVSLDEYLQDLRSLVPAMVPCRVASAERPDWLTEMGSTSALAAPITNTDGRVTGVLVVSQARHRPSSGFGIDHARRLGALADHASIAIENGVLFARLEREARQRAHQASHDSLTGLPNRTRLGELLDEAIEATYAVRGRLGLVVVDLDSFSQVIDAFGHRSADALLRQACERIKGLVPDGSIVSRLGADQFAIVVADIGHLDEAVEVARVVMAGFDPPFQSEGVLLALGVNVGVAVYPEHAIDVPSLVQRAHIAADAACRHRSGWEVYDAVHDPATPRRLALGADLREALELGDLDVCFQPKVEMASGVVRGAEALVRWNHPRLGRVRPSEFIPVAEHTGDIRALTMVVMRKSLAQCREWRDLGLDLSVAVNLSASNLLDLHLVDDVAQLVDEFGVPPSALTLELTESMVMSESQRSVDVLAGLAELGVCLSCDDFGTGYSSLAHLQRLPIGEIKIDRSFVTRMAVQDSDRSIARWMLALGRDLGLRTVAEGVESRDSWDLLTSLGCDLAQGFIVCPPLTAQQFGDWLDRRLPGELPQLDGSPAVIDLERSRSASAPLDDGAVDGESGAPDAAQPGDNGQGDMARSDNGQSDRGVTASGLPRR